MRPSSAADEARSSPVQIRPSGTELAARRKAAGLTQAELAQRAGCGRSAVQYWERLDRLDPAAWAVKAMAEALGWHLPALFADQYARAWAWGLMLDPAAKADAMAAALFEAWKAREAQRAATRRVICGAKTRKGTLCRCKSEPGKRRCKFHGGKSTGPKTPEGKARIAQAQRLRWDTWRLARGVYHAVGLAGRAPQRLAKGPEDGAGAIKKHRRGGKLPTSSAEKAGPSAAA